MAETILKVAGISKRFGGLQALSEVGITIERGQVYGLIGPNGAGKTTFFNVITGLYTPDSGTFELAGKPYQPTAVHEVAKAGIARTFQNIRLFAEMTALENVMVGRHIRTHSGLLGAMFRTPGFKAEEKAIAKRAQELLDYVGVGKYADFKARTLSYGDQRRLEIARALATDPAAWSAPPTKIRNPWELSIAAYRAFQRPPDDPGPSLNALNLLGMPLWQPGGPNGFSDFTDAWTSPEGMKTRLELATQFAHQLRNAPRPLQMISDILGPAVSEATREGVMRAESEEQAYALLLLSPEFQRR